MNFFSMKVFQRAFSPLFFCFLLLLFCGCSKKETEKKLRIGVSVPAPTHLWAGGVVWNAEEMKKIMEKENPDMEVLIYTSHDTTDQANKIENLVARGVDALVVMCQESGPVTEICERAKRRGTYLVVVSNPLDTPVEDVFVNGDNVSFGIAAADAIGTMLDGKGQILVMEGNESPIDKDRVRGFRKTLAEKYPSLTVLDSQPAFWSTEKGLSLMENFLQKHAHVDAVWAGDDDVLIGALRGYQGSKRSDVRGFVGGGGQKGIVKRILDGDPLVRATVTYPPQMIRVGIQAARDALLDPALRKSGRREIIIPSQIVTRENAKDHYFPDSAY